MTGKQNSVATPLVKKAYDLHKMIYRNAYPYPLDIKIVNHSISVEFHNVFKSKYLPFLFALVVISGYIGFGCCLFLPFYKFFFQSSIILDIFIVILSIFLGCACFLELGIYLAFWNSTEIGTLINQLFRLEQNRESNIKYIVKGNSKSNNLYFKLRLPISKHKIYRLAWHSLSQFSFCS